MPMAISTSFNKLAKMKKKKKRGQSQGRREGSDSINLKIRKGRAVSQLWSWKSRRLASRQQNPASIQPTAMMELPSSSQTRLLSTWVIFKQPDKISFTSKIQHSQDRKDYHHLNTFPVHQSLCTAQLSNKHLSSVLINTLLHQQSIFAKILWPNVFRGSPILPCILTSKRLKLIRKDNRYDA